ncbi:hypothetical protein ACFW93_00500 [Streptomyces canus]|uniref:hypothetical protein n=1 Tax=Streptomyces canus TaxID=58343 RepID=UPI0036A0FCFE
MAFAADTTLYVDDEAAGCNDTGPGSAAEPFCQIQPAADAAGTADAPVTVGADGSLRIHNALGSVDVVADLEGYYG